MAEELVLKASMKDDLSRPIEHVEDKIDDVTAATKKLEAASKSANSTLDKTATRYGATARAADSLTRGTGATARAAQNADNRLNKLARGGMSATRDLAMSTARYTTYGATALVAAGGAATLFGIKTAASMQTSRIAFETMLGSGRKADVFLKDLAAFAAKTPFDFPGLQTAASSLISAGIDANKVIPIMTTLGDVTSGMGTGAEGIQRATIALQQMNAAQKVNAEDLNQLRDAGIPVYDLLSASMGKTKKEIAGMAAAGTLGAEGLDAIMKGLETGKGLERFNGLMEKQSASLEGTWSTLKDTFGMGMANALQPAIPVLTDLTLGASDLVGKGIGPLSDGIADLVRKGQELYASGQLQQWAKEGKDGVVEFWDAVGPLVGSLFELGKDALPVVGQTLGTVVGLIETGARVLTPLVDGFNDLPDAGKKALIFAAAIYLVSQRLGDVRQRGADAIEQLRGVDKRMVALRTTAGLAGGALMTFAGDVGETHQGLGDLMTIGGSIATGFAVAGPIGAALGGLGGAFSVFAGHSKAAAEEQDKLNQAGQRVAETLDHQTGAFTELTKAQTANELAKSGVLKTGMNMGIDPSVTVDAALGNVQAKKEVSYAQEGYRQNMFDQAKARGDDMMGATAKDMVLPELTKFNAALGTTTEAIRKEREQIDLVNQAMGKTPATVKTRFDINTDAGVAAVDKLNRAIDRARARGAAVGGTGSAGRTGTTASGDTATRHGWGGSGGSRLGRTLAAHNGISGRLGGGYRVTNALTGGGGAGRGSGDHQAGRAVDVTGRNLPAYAREVRAGGGYARIHGEGSRKHVHAVMGDTATPHGGSMAGSSRGGISIDVGGIHIHGSGLSPDEVAAAVQKAIDAIIREAEETTA